MNQQRILLLFPDITTEELYTLESMMKDMTETQQQNFLSIYKGRRKDKQMMLLLAAIGFLGVAGIHRFIIGDIGMGILYILTAGLCWIGTIVDMVNINTITLRHNQVQAAEAANIIRMMNHPNPLSY